MKKLLLVTMVLLCLMGCVEKQHIDEVKVREAIASQMNEYPLSTLKDLYKSFFQDYWGARHLVADSTQAKNYLRREYEGLEDNSIYFAPTGWRANYVRVSLSVIDSLISFDAYFDAFLKSCEVKEDSISFSQWVEEWAIIEKVIEEMELNLANYEVDKREINENLAQGIYEGHHSEQFFNAYHPHYRIIRKAVFEQDVEPWVK